MSGAFLPGRVSGEGNRCVVNGQYSQQRGVGASVQAGRAEERRNSHLGALDILHMGEIAFHCWKGKDKSVPLMENALGFLERAP